MQKRIYIVKAGDTLSKIADKEVGDIDQWQDIAYINSIKEPYIIQPGQQILLPEEGAPLEITIDKYAGANDQAAPVQKATVVFNPATIALFVAGAALIYFWDDL